MKKLLYIITVIILLDVGYTFGQASNSTNLYGPNFYLGWTTVNNLPFRLGGPAVANTLMELNVNGNFGIGNGYPFTPTSLLHLHKSTGIALYNQFSNSNTNHTATDGFLVGIASGGNAELNQQEPLHMNFFTVGSQRMTILGNTNPGFVGIGLAAPTSLLHQEVSGNNDTYHQFTNTGNTGSVERSTNSLNPIFLS